MQEVRVGILGFAHGHVAMYCTRWRKEPELGVRLVAGWDRDPSLGAKQCQQFQVEHAGSVEELLARHDVEAVVIGAETSLHAELVERAAATGKAIALQKPMALTMDEADRIVNAVARYGVPFTMAWQMRVDPPNLKMRELLASGQFGKIFMVRRRHGLPMILTSPAFRDTWHLKPEYNRDIWADDAAHPIDFMYWLFGMPRSVTAELGTLYDPIQPNDNGIAIFRYADGMIAEVVCSFTCLAGENTTEIVAEKGVIIQNYGDLPSSSVPRPAGGIALKWYLRAKGDWTVDDSAAPANQGGRIANLAGPLAEFLRGKRPAIATEQEGRDVLRMVLACYDSATQGRRVHFGP
jgi:predicted dehydrogenase